MKKSIKRSLIAVGILFLVIIIIALIISPIAKWYVEKHSKDLVGRVITVEKLRVNIFTGSLKIVDFDLKEKDGEESFFKFDTLSVRVKLFDFLKHRVTVKRIHLSNMHLNIYQHGSVFNFDDIIQKFESTDTVPPPPPAKESKPWEIGIYDIQLRTGNIFYKDLVVGSKWDMEDLNLKIPGVYFSGQETDIGFNLLFADGGSLGSQLQYDIEKSAFRIQLDLEHFSIAGLLPYLQQTMRLETLSGILDAHIHIDGEVEHIMNSVVKGTVELHSLDMRDDRKELVLSAENLLVDMAEVSLAESKYNLHQFSAHGVSTRYVSEKDSSSNFTYLMKESEATPTDTVAAKGQTDTTTMHLSIGKVDMQGIQVAYIDNALQIPFRYELNDISVTAKNFDPDKYNDIVIQGKLNVTGILDAHWKGNFNDLSNLNLKIDLNSVELKDFTPYSMEYFAYPITSGILTFASQNVITSNMLKGTNGLDVFKCNVDKKSTEVKPEMKVPLRLAVYVLKDRNDKIKIDLPVEGDIRSPKFSYKKIIISTLINLLVKVSLTPLDFLAGSMGFKADQLDEIEFTNMQEEFTSTQYDRFNQLSAIIQAKPDLSLELQQDINYTQAIREQSLASLKQDYYLKKNPRNATDSLDMLDKAEIAKIRDNDPDLLKYANEQLSQPIEGDIYTKAIAIYKDRVNEQIDKLASKRNQLLQDYLVTRGQVPATNIKITTVPAVPGKTYDSKSVFKTALSLPGEEPLTEDAVEPAGS